ncbi:MAG: uroporphyrinogen decarboxylase [Parachlamydiales bacterium]|nr:uroporphyrinogen decarboxylase [Parachlamydiales bacterium]
MTSLFENALSGRNHAGRPPIWLMRQAGRYMPSYRQLRSTHTIKQMFKTPALIDQVTRMPIDQLGVDAAILFSDILIVYECLGIEWDFVEKQGPVIQRLENPGHIDSLKNRPVEEALFFVKEGIESLVSDIKIPLIGFCGGPFTVASYMIEGGSSKELSKTKKWLYSHPEDFHKLLDKITSLSCDYIKMQEKAGVKAIQLFDSWAGLLGPEDFAEFSLKYLKRLQSSVSVPVILFCRGSSHYYKEMATIKPTGISLDWQANLNAVRRDLGPSMVLQGNLDPAVLYAPQSVIKTKVQFILNDFQNDPSFIFNLGHGVMPDIPLENVQYLVRLIQESATHNTIGSYDNNASGSSTGMASSRAYQV